MSFPTRDAASARDHTRDHDSDHIQNGADQALSRILLTYDQAAAILAIGRTSVYELVWSGRLTPVHIGRSVRIKASELERFVDDLK